MEILIYCMAWLSFGLAHSLLANINVKQKLMPYFKNGYRLFYNGFAIFHFGLVYGLGFYLFQDFPIFVRSDFLIWIQTFSFITGVIFLIWALRHYDMGLFSGLKQLKRSNKGESIDESEALSITGLHTWVRHPLYSACFLILWGRVDSEFTFYTAIFGSLYFIIGSRFEERSLIRQYGSDYEYYKQKVPAFIPYRGPQTF